MQVQESYEERRSKIPPEKRRKWEDEQDYIKGRMVLTDDFTWKLEDLRYVAGVDVSFSRKFPNGACAALIIFDALANKVVYQDCKYVKLTEEYVPGFLAFRELPPTLQLFRKLKADAPHMWPQLIMVDANGMLHQRQCGYACHLGVVLDTPTVGCAKTFFDIDGLHASQVTQYLSNRLGKDGQNCIVRGKSGKAWCSAILSDARVPAFVFVSIGTKISLQSANRVVLGLLQRQLPEPVYLADRESRRLIKRMNEKDYASAQSYEMVYLH